MLEVQDAVALALVPGASRRVAMALRRIADEERRLQAPRSEADARPQARTGDPTRLDAVLAWVAPGGRATAGSLRAAAHRALEVAGACGIEPIIWNDPRYPASLAAIPDPPAVLWTRGRAEALSAPAVAIVGSRAASPYAVEVAERLASDLATRGLIIVSGLARGVDGAAHRGALEAGGQTLAVLGSGTDVIYPAEHATLARRIAEQGAIISELAPGTPPRPYHFPLRNRIISGLSLAVVVVEASERSGSLITADCALEQGREVMAVPGNALSGRNRGSHALIRDGARLVECAGDVLDELGLGSAPSDRRPGVRERPADPVLGVMAAGETYDLDELGARSGVEASKLLPRLLELELGGAVRRAGGGRFVRAR